MFEKPSIEILEKYNLVYHDGKPFKPFFIGHNEVWATAINEKTPIYAMYYGGTNSTVILKKEYNKEWEEVKDYKNSFYCVMWRIGAYLSQNNITIGDE